MLIQFPLSGEEQTVFNYEFWQRTGLESACSFELFFFVTCQFAQAVLKGGHEMDSVGHQEGL